MNNLNSIFQKAYNTVLSPKEEIAFNIAKSNSPKYSHYEMYDEIMKQIRDDTTKDDNIRMPSVHAVIYSKN